MEILKELWTFLRVRKKLWLAPIIIIMLIKNMLLSATYVQPKAFMLKCRQRKILIYGGERGIRTLDSVATIHAFQAC